MIPAEQQILEATGEPAARFAHTRAVLASAELRRIAGLPRRALEDGQALADEFTEIFRTVVGQQKLRPIQALALREIAEVGGLLGPMRVGAGKTLVCFLAPEMVRSRRPLLIVPAKLKEKTRREFRQLAIHWLGPQPNAYRIESCEFLGRVNAHQSLSDYAPDLIVIDEAQKLKNVHAAVTRRLLRYLEEHPQTKLVCLSGTMTQRSLNDFAHLAKWTMRSLCPVPLHHLDLEQWANAIDEKVSDQQRIDPGALFSLCDPAELERARLGDGIGAVRSAFRRRLTETPGCVATQDGELGVSLTISCVEPKSEGAEINAAFDTLRSKWETPDGQPIADGLTAWRHAHELALGFFYRWDPYPPEEWLEPRRLWASTCRALLQGNRRNLDSERQIVDATLAGLYPDARAILDEWLAVKATFEPNNESVWISSEALDAAKHWIDSHKGRGIVWVEHREFGKRLAKETGLAYYGRNGVDAKTGKVVEQHKPGQILIASRPSNFEGRNLQAWSENLVMFSPTKGAIWEQMIGRTHRDGQANDEVTVDVYLSCVEQWAAFEQARNDARYMQDVTGQAQKLAYADVTFPTEIEIMQRAGSRWKKEQTARAFSVDIFDKDR